jgi:hypothetical protein
MTNEELAILRTISIDIHRAVLRLYEVKRSDLMVGPVLADGDREASDSFAPFYGAFATIRNVEAAIEELLKSEE